MMRLITVLLALTLIASRASAQDAKVWTPDNGNGTFTNPIMCGDWPDPDVIRVDDTFYFISTSMHYVPGCPVATSKDLVNWEMAGYAVNRYREDPRYDMVGGNRYLKGSWASTIRFHNGLFYVGFCTPSDGQSNGKKGEPGHFSICTAKDIKGPWTRTIFPEYLYDPGLLFDDDGKVYVAHGQGTIYITRLADDALSVADKPVKVLEKLPVEGSHLYKINGKYYLFSPAGGIGSQMCFRSDKIYGPYEKQVVMHDTRNSGYGVHQGGLVQLKNGDWWCIIMEDRGAIGRAPRLEPVTWIDGWPMVGRKNDKGDWIGMDVAKKPDVGAALPITVPSTSDEFDSPQLGLQWQWNHNPDPESWSLTQRPGYLRLKALKTRGNQLAGARNTLTQRVQGRGSEASTEIDVSGLKDGDVVGLGVFEFPFGFVAVQQDGATRKIFMRRSDSKNTPEAAFTADTIWFKAKVTESAGFNATFFYSTDGKTYLPIGDGMKMGLGLTWTANRFALFNYSTNDAGLGGTADFNWFHFSGSGAK